MGGAGFMPGRLVDAHPSVFPGFKRGAGRRKWVEAWRKRVQGRRLWVEAFQVTCMRWCVLEMPSSDHLIVSRSVARSRARPLPPPPPGVTPSVLVAPLPPASRPLTWMPTTEDGGGIRRQRRHTVSSSLPRPFPMTCRQASKTCIKAQGVRREAAVTAGRAQVTRQVGGGLPAPLRLAATTRHWAARVADAGPPPCPPPRLAAGTRTHDTSKIEAGKGSPAAAPRRSDAEGRSHDGAAADAGPPA